MNILHLTLLAPQFFFTVLTCWVKHFVFTFYCLKFNRDLIYVEGGKLAMFI